MKYELEFRVLKNAKSEVVGFSLTSGGETFSEQFCCGFAEALVYEGTSIEVSPSEGKIVFRLLGTGDHTVTGVDPGELETIKQLLETDARGEQTLNILYEPYTLSHGFRVVLLGEVVVERFQTRRG